VSAKIDQRTLLKQAEEEFHLIDERPQSVQVEEALKNKLLIQLRVAEELMLAIEEGDLAESLNPDSESVYSLKDQIEFDIRKDFLNTLKADSELTKDLLQEKINTLALEVEKEGYVRLIQDSLVYSAQSASLEWGGKVLSFKATHISHYFLNYMFNSVQRGVLVDKDELFEELFGKELSIVLAGEKNTERNKQVKALHNVMTAINQRIQTEFKTVDKLFSANTGGYVRNY
jgi:hypothetical protein